MTTLAAIPERHAGRTAFAAVHAAFVLNGAVTTLLAPALPLLAARWGLSDAQAGRLFLAQFIGSITGNLVSLWLAPRAGFRAALAAGYCVIAAGFAALAFAVWPQSLAFVVLFGVGIGMTIPASNVFVAESRPATAGAALNILNFAWTAGAIACPWAFAAAHTQHSISLALVAFAVASALSAAMMLAARWPLVQHTHKERTTFDAVSHPGRWLAVLGTLFFLYIGTEAALVGWISTYATRVGHDARGAAVVVPSFFWAAVLLTRLAAPAYIREAREPLVARAGLAIAALGTVMVLTADGMAGLIAGITLVGLGLAPVFPLFLALMSRAFGPASAKAASLLYIIGGIGGASMPWLVGVWSTGSGSLQRGLVLPLAAMVVMLAVHLALARQELPTSA